MALMARSRTWVACGIALTGCNVLPNAPRDLGECGIALAIWLRHPDQGKYEYFRVDAGEFGYGAGPTALALKTSWTTDLSREQCAELLALARAGGWLEADHPKVEIDRGGLHADIAVAWDADAIQFTLEGDSPALKSVVALLRTITQQRFERFINKLPESGKQR